MAGASWPALVPGAKAKASEVEAKFDWIEEDLVPMTGGTRTDDSYDLGETTHRWRDIRISRQIILPKGSDTMPSLSVQGTATGMFFPTTTAIGFAVNGVEVQRCMATGTRKFAHPIFMGRTVAYQTITAAGVATFPVTHDVGGNFTTTGIFTAPIDGTYMFAAGVAVYSAGNVSRHRLYFRENSTISSDAFVAYGQSSVNYDFLNLSGSLELSAGSTVDCWVTGTAGSDMVLCSPSGVRYFCGYLIG